MCPRLSVTRTCAALHCEYFSGTQGKELKHKNLGKYRSGQRRIVDLVEAIQDLGKFTAWICHKEFALLTYLVDLWVETGYAPGWL